jgi:hypothetical protein
MVHRKYVFNAERRSTDQVADNGRARDQDEFIRIL